MTEALKPIEICLGNFIESIGCVEMVTGNWRRYCLNAAQRTSIADGRAFSVVSAGTKVEK